MLKTNVEVLEDSRTKLTVTIPAEQVDAAVAEAYKQLAKEVRLPGFRPGKAPRKMIEQALGSDYALNQAAENLINRTYGAALDQESLRVMGEPKFDDPEDLVEGKEFTYSVSVETRPTLKLKSTDIEITMPPRETTEAEIDAQVEEARNRLAGLEPVEDRGIEEHDFAMISFTSTLNGEDYEGSQLDKYMYQLGEGLMPEQFEAALIGVKAGEKAVAEFVVEASGANEEFAGKTIHFDIEVHEIKQKVLPELNDDFAVSSGFESLENMREEIKNYIGSQKEQSYDRILDERLVSALTTKLEGDVPEALVESRKASMRREFEDMLKSRSLELDQYLAMSQIDREGYEADLATQAHIATSQDLALEALAAQEGIEPSEEDIAVEYREIADALKMTVDEAKEKWAELGLVTSMKSDIVRRKAVEWLRENAKVNIDEQAM